MRQRRNGTRRLIVSGAGPGGLCVAIAAIRQGVPADGVTVLEKRGAAGDRAGTPIRERVVVLDDSAEALLGRLGVRLPGTAVGHLVMALDDGALRYFPNAGGWRTAVSALFGGRALARLTTLAELEASLLAALHAAGAKVRFGAEAVVAVTPDRPATVRSGGEELTAELVVVAEGARSRTVAAYAKRIRIAADPASQFLCLDFAGPGGGVTRGGDLASRMHAGLGTLTYGFVAGGAASFNMLLPNGADVAAERQRSRYLLELAETARSFGWTGAARDPTGTLYSGDLVMADRTRLGDEVVLIGDALRSTDPIAGAGANAAIGDAGAIGRYVEDCRTRGREQAMIELSRRLAAQTANALEMSLLIREHAAFALRHPRRTGQVYRSGLTGRSGTGNAIDRGKGILAEVIGLALGPEAHAAAFLSLYEIAGGPRPPFASAERQRLIGPVHPADRATL